MDPKPYMVEQVIKYSDGTETVISYRKNGEQEVIEAKVEQEVEAHRGEKELEVTEEVAEVVVEKIEVTEEK